MNTRLIPVIVIFLSPIIGILFAPTSTDLSSSILALGVWSFLTWCCLLMIAYWVYEDGKKIGPSTTYLWNHVKKLETSEKMIENLIEELDRRIKKLEEKEKK